jgi:NAD(P)-dependent dehydrogenase (short-subunit alcohol dehydrogenase family)
VIAMLPKLIDATLDRLVVPGYSRLGYAARAAVWHDSDPGPGALAGKTVVVTGATSGIGQAAAEGVARLGATTVLVGHSEERLEDAARMLRATVPSAGFRTELADVSSLAAVRELARRLNGGESLHAVVHNAGVMPHERAETDEGNELTLATHVLGPHLLTRLLSPTPARTIWVSSGGMYAQKLDVSDPQLTQGHYNGTTAYAKTKRMQVVLAQEWAQRLRGEGVVHAMHPGWVATSGLTDGLATFAKVTRPILRTPAEGADTIVWLAAAPEAAASTGRFWHDRCPRPTHYLPRTCESAADRAALWDLCERLTAD